MKKAYVAPKIETEVFRSSEDILVGSSVEINVADLFDEDIEIDE